MLLRQQVVAFAGNLACGLGVAGVPRAPGQPHPTGREEPPPPEGAVIGLANSKIGDPDDNSTRAAPGRVVWTELLSGDPVAASAFYRLLAGLDIEVIERRGGLYTLLSANGVNRAGIMPKPAEEVEPVWLTYFGVSDPKSAAARAKELGGTVLVPPSPELREGTMAIVTDPVGAVLVLQKVPM